MTCLGILGSTRGTVMHAVYSAIEQRKLPATIGIVISNKPNAVILERAKTLQLPAQFIDPAGLTRDAYDQQVTICLQQHHVDFIVLIGYMRILSHDFVEKWHHKIINVHPSLLPLFAGKMDLDVHRAVLAARSQETGCTVHYVTDDIDAGPILLQKRCIVLKEDTPERLKERVQALEGQALVEVLAQLCVS
ncbi:MAG: phosphoribosylglycinamide formyltransferase [Gammaproteobacteria bacterium RIFCSPHIGHO2_12_FULL_37_34]|nr:MAG: phosphoribosylglycinamide formyltransferase [Gammaproteobacteria bacterium RIFCSPHIGHO2_12_FULL_37_34]